MANTGTYLKSTDITNNLAKAFLDKGKDLGVYFDWADAQVLNVALQRGVLPGTIALDTSGNLLDPNLKQYAKNCFYIQLFTDMMGAYNSTDNGNLGSSAYDKYQKMAESLQAMQGELLKKISTYTVRNIVNKSDVIISIFEMRRA